MDKNEPSTPFSTPKEATEEQQNKLAIWKCWILFLGLQEAKEGYIQHTRLHSVATNLRLAEKPTHFSRNTFLDIFPDLLDLDLIGDDIHQKADSRIALLRKENALSDKERTLLNAIKSTGKGILGREPYKSKSAISPSNYRLLLGIPGKEDSNVQFSETFLVDTGHQEPIDIPGTDSGRDLRSVGTQPESSYGEQKSDVVNTLLTEVGKHQLLSGNLRRIRVFAYLFVQQHSRWRQRLKSGRVHLKYRLLQGIDIEDLLRLTIINGVALAQHTALIQPQIPTNDKNSADIIVHARFLYLVNEQIRFAGMQQGRNKQ